jgi:hypothetical protein
MGDDESITWRGAVVLIGVVSVVALLMSAGTCGQADSDRQRTRAEVEHLERRLDGHLRDHGR